MADLAALAERSGWDGSCMYKGSPNAAPQPVTPEDVRTVREAARTMSDGSKTYDFKIGSGVGPDALPAFAAAGATWWTRWIAPGDTALTRSAIADGPPALRRDSSGNGA
jgi:hypothetical protein